MREAPQPRRGRRGPCRVAEGLPRVTVRPQARNQGVGLPDSHSFGGQKDWCKRPGTVTGIWQALRNVSCDHPVLPSSHQARCDPSLGASEVTGLPPGFVLGTHFNCFHFTSFISFVGQRTDVSFLSRDQRQAHFQRGRSELRVAGGRSWSRRAPEPLNPLNPESLPSRESPEF